MFMLRVRPWLYTGLLLPTLVFAPVVAQAAAKPEPTPAAQAPLPDADALRSLLQERVDTLAKLVHELTVRYQAGAVDFAAVAAAEKEFLNATLDLYDTPQERIPVLKKYQAIAADIEHLTESRFKVGAGTETDVLEAKAELLDAQIQVLREERKTRPTR